ncbi:MAG: hypothetical protein IT325_01250, partial [Anaerolineae bacterium]|nr:hypothetical protein [Anaerolineae bacterium]
MAKIFPWVRAVVIILSLSISQFAFLSASASVPGDPPRSPVADYENECWIEVMVAAVE